jgi:hypothetical protein
VSICVCVKEFRGCRLSPVKDMMDSESVLPATNFYVLYRNVLVRSHTSFVSGMSRILGVTVGEAG